MSSCSVRHYDKMISEKRCSVNKCDESTNSENALTCETCKRLVHHECTLLPEYQLLLFFGVNGYSDYTCYTCIKNDFYMTETDPFEEVRWYKEIEKRNAKLENECTLLIKRGKRKM